MAFLNCCFKSNVLGQDVCFNAVIPEGIPDNIKTVYLLHGLSDNHTSWSRMTSCERYAKENGIALIMPNVDRSFYTDMCHGRKYYTYISEELLNYTRQLFKLSTKREDTFIAGLSMGGYGAFKIALRNPHIFEAAASFSGVLDIDGRFTHEKTWDNEKYLVFGDAKNLENSDENLKYLIDNFDEKIKKPRLYQACGTEDFLYEDNQRFRSWIKGKGFTHIYDEGPGGHEWSFWDAQLKKAIEFFVKG